MTIPRPVACVQNRRCALLSFWVQNVQMLFSLRQNLNRLELFGNKL